MVALSMADGYARLTSKPQCVVIHVDVGTQGLGAAVHNASTGRAPVLIFAGLSPYTLTGVTGSRTEYIHWIQDVPDQKQILAQYCRYVGEIKTGRNVKEMVRRALGFATSDPKGPVYLVGAREVMEEEVTPYELVPEHWLPIEPAALPPQGVSLIAKSLVSASSPLLITGYSGRNHATVPELLSLTTTIPGLRVLDTAGSDMCFPSTHRAWLGLRYGIHDAIPAADVILVIDCDVPWIDTYCHPNSTARVFHVDVDPLKQQMPVFYLAAERRYRADCYTALKQVNEFLTLDLECRHELAKDIFKQRWDALGESHSARIAHLGTLALPPTNPGAPTTPAYLASLLRTTCPTDTIFAIEAVTNTLYMHDHLRNTLPGTWLNCGGGGLGWSGGASLGIKLAAGSKRFVCVVVGDGTFLFSVPGSVWWVARHYGLGVLVVVLNNGGWHAPRRSTLLVHPDGLSSSASLAELNLGFGPACPDYGGLARAGAGGGEDPWVWTGKVKGWEGARAMVEEGVEIVKGGRGGLLEVVLGE
jgi:thiamine pyrophosphate-dependent acetolactate synthase large subunit-like protein